MLERRPMIGRGADRNAPVRHRHVGIERGRLQERALRLDEPERVICETPWLKKRRASSELVVTGMSVLPGRP
jgi:hypothetical protein